MLKQRVRMKRTVRIENGKPRHGAVWESIIAVKKLYKRAIKQAELVQSKKRSACQKICCCIMIENFGKNGEN